MKVLKAGKELNEWKANNTPKYCPICGREMLSILSRNRVVDHDHETGEIRGVLCRNCNGCEGRIKAYCDRSKNFIDRISYLENLIAYWKKTAVKHTGVYYPGTKVVNGKVTPPKKKRRKRRTK